MQRVPKREDNQPLVLEEFDVSSGPSFTQGSEPQDQQPNIQTEGYGG